jgi:DNA-binding FrmR family transcriptional regulator
MAHSSNFTSQTKDLNVASTKISTALKKASGSIHRTLCLINQNPDCDELLIHIDSAIGSLRSARQQIIEHFVDRCLNDHINQPEKLKKQLLKLYKFQK